MSERRVPDLQVERLALGELPPHQAARVRKALGDEADARLSALARDDAEQLERLSPSRVAAEVERRLAAASPGSAPSSRGGFSLWIPALAVSAAAVVLLLWLRPDDDRSRSETLAHNDVTPPGADAGDTAEIVYVKGDARMWIDKLGPSGSQRLSSGDIVTAGDRLQVHYDAADHELGVIVSIDGRGVVTLHSPGEPDAVPALASGGGIALDHSYELDDAPAFERFFFVTAPRGEELRVDDVMAAARALAGTPPAQTAPLRLPEGLHQTSILLKKR